jgi:thiamine-monophosphate kinase
MIDVSDGLVADLGHVARASGVRIELQRAAFEIPSALAEVASALRVDPMSWILGGGEDHALVATFRSFDAVPDGWHQIGIVVGAQGEGDVRVDGNPYAEGGFDHFA